jgi:hypothetical protein
MVLLAAVLLAGAWLGTVRPAEARAQQGSGAARPAEPATLEPPVPTTSVDPLREKLQVAAGGERHKRLVEDSDRLLQLATELKEEVDKSTKNEMSVTAIKKAAEIEKLARDVKDRMKGD